MNTTNEYQYEIDHFKEVFIAFLKKLLVYPSLDARQIVIIGNVIKLIEEFPLCYENFPIINISTNFRTNGASVILNYEFTGKRITHTVWETYFGEYGSERSETEPWAIDLGNRRLDFYAIEANVENYFNLFIDTIEDGNSLNFDTIDHWFDWAEKDD